MWAPRRVPPLYPPPPVKHTQSPVQQRQPLFILIDQLLTYCMAFCVIVKLIDTLHLD